MLYMRLTICAILGAVLSGCFGSRVTVPELPRPADPANPANLGDILRGISHPLIWAGIIGIIGAAVVYRLAGKGAGQLVGTIAVSALLVGVSGYMLGPYIEIIFWSALSLVCLAGAWIVRMNWARLLRRAEDASGLEIDGEPNP